jgi:two-component system, OmpR family, sensor kinase
VKAIATRYGGDVTLANRADGRTGIVASIGFPVQDAQENEAIAHHAATA